MFARHLLLLDEIAGGLTEHVVHALLSVAQRLVVLTFGKLIADGKPDAVINSRDVKSVYLGEDAHVLRHPQS